jgi:glycosyltransferase involved in cell wall biosynthesis
LSALTGKTILIVSPQSWGKMFISKHHYAIELAKKGNKVFFLNPPRPRDGKGKNISIMPSGVTDNLFLIDHCLWFPYNIKFHALRLFHWLMKFHIKAIVKATGPLDIIWSFDLGNFYPFRFWKDVPVKIFHPVDEPLNAAAINSATGADIIFSVTHEILQKYKSVPAGKHFINHGVSEDFLLTAGKEQQAGNAVRVGFAGNLLREDIDREVLLQIIKQNPLVVFECWGSYSAIQSNIGGGEDGATKAFIESLQQQENVLLHGAVPSAELARTVHRMDAFLICYDVQKDQSKGTNYHKIMEYLSTGKVIVSNNVTTYKDDAVLMQMVKERDHNRSLPQLFSAVIQNIQQYNSASNQDYRVAFARDNTYKRQIDRIESILHAR